MTKNEKQSETPTPSGKELFSSDMPSGEIPLVPVCSGEIAPAIVAGVEDVLKELAARDKILGATEGKGDDLADEIAPPPSTPLCYDTTRGELRPEKPSAYKK